jgi:hypothetical protein
LPQVGVREEEEEEEFFNHYKNDLKLHAHTLLGVTRRRVVVIPLFIST